MMSRHLGRMTSTSRREIAAVVTEWERGQLDRRSLLRRAAGLGLGSVGLAALVGGEAPRRGAAAGLRGGAGDPAAGGRGAAGLRGRQDAPAAGVRGGTLRVATIGEPPHLDEHQSTADLIALIGY